MIKKILTNHMARILLVWIIFGLVITSGLFQLIVHSGWPTNHEYYSFFQRSDIYRLHFLDGDFLPLWSTCDNLRLGSPLPTLYHKLYYLAYAIISLVVPVGKPAILAVIAVWLFVGAWGMVALSRSLGLENYPAYLSGLMLICANYTVTDWLVRGAMAEFAAAMLVPWFLTGWVRSLRQERLTILLGVALASIFYAHSTLAYYLVLLLILCVIVLLCSHRMTFSIFIKKSSWLSIFLCTLLCLPYLVPMLIIGQDYDMTRILTPPFLPRYCFHSPLKYLWDPTWIWGQRWDSYTVQLDFAVLALLFLSCLCLFICRLYNRRPTHFSRFFKSGIVSLTIILCFCLLAQFSFSEPIYRLIPGAEFLQFPWRLLAVITPILVVLSLTACYGCATRRLANIFCTIAMVCMGYTWGALAPIQYKWIPLNIINLNEVHFSAFGEYVPTRAGYGGDIYAIKMSLSKQNIPIKELTLDHEPLIRRFQITSDVDKIVALPAFSSKIHGIRIDKKERPCLEVPGFAGFCGVQIHPGLNDVEVLQPTFGRVLRYLLGLLPSHHSGGA